jgi:hypothetical protein
VGAGVAGGYLTSPRLKHVHWQPSEDRPVPESAVTEAGESALFVDPSEIPASADVAKLGQALAYLDEVYELKAGRLPGSAPARQLDGTWRNATNAGRAAGSWNKNPWPPP